MPTVTNVAVRGAGALSPSRYGGEGIFFFNDTATTEIYTLSLHDALPISEGTGLDNQECQNHQLEAHTA